MARTPIRQQNGPFAGPNNAGRARKLPPRVVRMPGPSQPLEQFGQGLPANVARALNAVQQNALAAMGPVKALPFADGNLLENVPITFYGGSAGGAPYNVLKHGLGRPWRGYDIKAVKGGYITAHAVVANPTSELDAQQIQLWVQSSSFSFLVAPTMDVWVYA
jgi:hypothetical protein